ncbi:hypothetical protein FSP39_006035 [Pinctada imbricata]|uniref:C1q domain-containing protein n=1 Tax=Pinctada imbricata TaxID=66713 RepID=A0AA89BV03_PINIB|nr:hypothetical protein FSP39_006035 [Pinctada imbricata]
MKAYSSLGERETVIFDEVVTNVGSGYDVNNGIFFCPINGIYIFAATMASADNNKNLDAEIVHQGKIVARLHATVYGYDMGSQVAMVQCQQGEKVWIRHMESAGDSKIVPAGYSGFSGALLHSM